MTATSFFGSLLAASNTAKVEEAVRAFEAVNSTQARWVPVGGKENNRGPIEVSADPGRSLVERLTNGIDAILEAEHERHRGVPECRSPRQAATTWMGISERGLSDMTPAQRQTIAKRITVKIEAGDSREARLVEVRDHGIGIRPESISETILSLNASNKIKKHYVAGTYGQGGSSTFAVSSYVFIASRCAGEKRVGFTLVKFLDLPAEDYKTGHYVYLTLNGSILTCELPESAFATGTLIRHFGYDLSSYPAPLGPKSIYGLLNSVLFDPVLPIWLDDKVHSYRRVIKGARNALNGAVDEGDERRRGPALDHNVPMFYVSLGDYGSVGFEYWVLERPSESNRRPSATFVNPTRPIILTINGQNHAELPATILRKEAELPYLSQRLIVHIDCDSLTPTAKRALFSSSREDARRGMVLQMIHDELVRIIKSDDELTRLNNEAKQHGMHDRDENAIQQMRREVARLLSLQGVNVGQGSGARSGGEPGDQPSSERPPRPPTPPRPQPTPIEVHEPPTFIRFAGIDQEAIKFYPGQRRYIRIETDANSKYHNPNNPASSRINIVVAEPGVLKGSTPLRGGRMRAIIEIPEGVSVGGSGLIRLELHRQGATTLVDQRSFVIHEPPPARPGRQQLTLPPFETRPVTPEDEQWAALGWPDDTAQIASSAEMENGTLVIYYSTVYPKYAEQFRRYEQRDPAQAASFKKRYEIWVATHSLLRHRDEQAAAGQQAMEEGEAGTKESHEQQERCRMATLAALFAAREVDSMTTPDLEVQDA